MSLYISDMRTEMVNMKANLDGKTPGEVFSCQNFAPGRLSVRKIESAGGFPFNRCSICRCPILQNGDFVLCLGCAIDGSLEITEKLKRKKAPVTRFEASYTLSDVNSPLVGGKLNLANPGKRSDILKAIPETKYAKSLFLTIFLPYLGLIAYMEVFCG